MCYRLIILIFFVIIISFNSEAVSYKANFGSCRYIGFNILKCIPKTCKMNMPYPKGIKITFQVYGKKRGLCVFNKIVDFRYQNIPYIAKTKCELDENGMIAAAEEFKKYLDGDYNTYLSSSKNPTLKSQCKLLEWVS